MPELPEVETTRRGIEPHILDRRVSTVTIHQPSLRYPVTDDLPHRISGRTVRSVTRRGKYLLLDIGEQTLMIHLGMSGSLRITARTEPLRKHDHIEIRFGDRVLRFHDPRRFGLVMLIDGPAEAHPLLASLGPEPLSENFDGDYLYQVSRKRKVAIKNLIMNSRIVVGVGNIYASEALFLAGIHPALAAGRLSRARSEKLVAAIKDVLGKAIKEGGTTLRDFIREEGQPGYFAQQLNVYGKTGEACPVCGKSIVSRVIGQRSSFYCTQCQK
ncbi:MAG: bifunctional DNA-formamidopyrimidine glycosylase/DNA-(apurinic or apyrimidinic site) lyase [Gammaproteobacteria bacterium]|jgi:formamidopyrimidine-DNA glycosylase